MWSGELEQPFHLFSDAFTLIFKLGSCKKVKETLSQIWLVENGFNFVWFDQKYIVKLM